MRLKISYEGMEIKPGEVVVIQLEKGTTTYQAKDIYETTKKAFPNNHVVVLPSQDYVRDIAIYNEKNFLRLLENMRKMVEGSTTE